MTKQDIKRQLQQYNNNAGVITKTQLATFFNLDIHHIDIYISGLERINKKYYLLNEVVDRIYEKKD